MEKNFEYNNEPAPVVNEVLPEIQDRIDEQDFLEHIRNSAGVFLDSAANHNLRVDFNGGDEIVFTTEIGVTTIEVAGKNTDRA